MQQTLTFPTSSHINVEKLTGQNKRLYDWLISGHRINCMDAAMKELGIGYLNSRSSDLIKAGVEIKKRFIKVNGTTVKEYWI